MEIYREALTKQGSVDGIRNESTLEIRKCEMLMINKQSEIKIVLN